MPVRSFNCEGCPGIVADARTVGLADEPAPHVFKPYAQFFAGRAGVPGRAREAPRQSGRAPVALPRPSPRPENRHDDAAGRWPTIQHRREHGPWRLNA